MASEEFTSEEHETVKRITEMIFSRFAANHPGQRPIPRNDLVSYRNEAIRCAHAYVDLNREGENNAVIATGRSSG